MKISYLFFLGLLLPFHNIAMHHGESDDQKALFSAAHDGDWDTLFSILDRYPHLINSRDYFAEKSLLDVVAAGCPNNQNAAVDRLFDRGFSLPIHVSDRNDGRWNWTPLHHAANKNNYEGIDVLCRNGCNKYINTQAYHGWVLVTPLVLAVIKNNFEVVKKLYEWGATIEAPCGPFLRTPLHIAALNESLEMVQLLVDLGADVYAKDTYGNKPGMSTWTSKAIKRLLKEAEKEREGATPLRLLRPLS